MNFSIKARRGSMGSQNGHVYMLEVERVRSSAARNDNVRIIRRSKII
jgi:hypothetical protein